MSLRFYNSTRRPFPYLMRVILAQCMAEFISAIVGLIAVVGHVEAFNDAPDESLTLSNEIDDFRFDTVKRDLKIMASPQPY